MTTRLLSPAYPTWTPRTLDDAGPVALPEGAPYPVTAVTCAAACVEPVVAHPQWCAAAARTNGGAGRWLQLRTEVGPLEQRGDVSAADGALAWLASGRS